MPVCPCSAVLDSTVCELRCACGIEVQCNRAMVYYVAEHIVLTQHFVGHVMEMKAISFKCIAICNTMLGHVTHIGLADIATVWIVQKSQCDRDGCGGGGGEWEQTERYEMRQR